MRQLLSITCLFLLTISLGVPAVSAADARLTDVSFAKSSGTEEVVIFKLTDISLPKVFGIEGEKPRIVCDFLNTELDKKVSRQINTKGNMIKAVRLGLHTTPSLMIRVVLDLIPGPDYDIQQTLLTEEKLFTISVNLAQSEAR